MTTDSATFIVQRPDYPEWFMGWNEHNLACWTSQPSCAWLVSLEKLPDTLARLRDDKPTAALFLNKTNTP